MLEQQAAMDWRNPRSFYVDGAYVSGQQLAQAQGEGRQLMGPAQPAGADGEIGYKSDAFDAQVEQRRATPCPAGHASTQCSRLGRGEDRQSQLPLRMEQPLPRLLPASPVRADGQKHRTLVVGQYTQPYKPGGNR